MAIHHAEIKKLCTRDEIQWIDGSFPPRLKALSESELKDSIHRGRTFRKKYRALGRGQRRAAKRGSTGSDARDFFGDAVAQRTSMKSSIFAEALHRYEEEYAGRVSEVSPIQVIKREQSAVT